MLGRLVARGLELSMCYEDRQLHRMITSGGGTPVSANSEAAAAAHHHIVAADEISVLYRPQPPAQMTRPSWIYASLLAGQLVNKAPHVITFQED